MKYKVKRITKTLTLKLKKMKSKTKIRYKINEDEEWPSAEKTKRAAKA